MQTDQLLKWIPFDLIKQRVLAFLPAAVTDYLQHIPVERELKLNAIIHGAAATAGGVGFFTAQIPGDRIVIGGIQAAMLLAIAREYEVTLDPAKLETFLTSLLMEFGLSLVGIFGAEMVAQVLKYIPGIGNLANTGTAIVITEIMGWITVAYFEKVNKPAAAEQPSETVGENISTGADPHHLN